MAKLVNKRNREVKVIIPNMREFRTFYSDNDGVIGMFFKRDWEEVKQDEDWKPSEEQIKAIRLARSFVMDDFDEHPTLSEILMELEEQLKKLM